MLKTAGEAKQRSTATARGPEASPEKMREDATRRRAMATEADRQAGAMGWRGAARKAKQARQKSKQRQQARAPERREMREATGQEKATEDRERMGRRAARFAADARRQTEHSAPAEPRFGARRAHPENLATPGAAAAIAKFMARRKDLTAAERERLEGRRRRAVEEGARQRPKDRWRAQRR